MGNYVLKHFLSEKELKELKLTVYTSAESLIKMDPDMSVRGKVWENIPSVRIILHALWSLVGC
jgi:hypothetical protein